MSDFPTRVAGIGALADPVRRELYLHVCAQDHAVSRDEAAAALDIPLHKAKFHLDRLADDGLLETEFARLSGRSGPGAGRPSKLYRRADREIAVSLPEREYELAGRLMATAIATSTRDGVPVLEALAAAADEEGRALARATPRSRSTDALRIACNALAEHGYEPRVGRDRAVLANCPFHALSRSHTELVCHMNLSLIDGLTDELVPDRLETRLEPAEGRCCVTLAKR